MADKLTNKQAAFVREYLVDFNATQAAIRVGYSPKTAYSQGARLLKNVEVLGAIQSHIMTAEEAMTRLTDIARGDMADLMEITQSGFTFRLLKDKDGERVVNPNTKLIKKIRQKVTTFLAKDESGEDREIIETELELYSALDALREIGKYHVLFTDKQQQSGDVTLRVVYDHKEPNV